MRARVRRLERGSVVFGTAREKVEGVGQDRQGGSERIDGAGEAAGQIEDDAGTQSSAKGAAEDGQRGLTAALGADQLGDARQHAFADGLGRFGGHIAGTNAGSAGGDDEVDLGGGVAECVFDDLLFVWNGKPQCGFEPGRV